MPNNKFYIQETQDYQVDTIAAFMVLKKAHENSVFYNSSPSYVAKHTGQCVNTAKKIIKLCIEAGLANINHKGHLVLISKHFMGGERNHDRRRKYGYFFINSTKYKDVKKEYRKILIKDKLKQMQFMATECSGTNIAGGRKTNTEKRNIGLRISSERLGEIVECSPVHANRIMKELVREQKGRKVKGRIRKFGGKNKKENFNHAIHAKKWGIEVKMRECNTYYLPLINQLSIDNLNIAPYSALIENPLISSSNT